MSFGLKLILAAQLGIIVTGCSGGFRPAATSNGSSSLAKLTVTVSQAPGQNDPVRTLPISFNITFSRPINASTFNTSDITQAGTASNINWSLTDTGDHQNFTLMAIEIGTEGTLTPFIAADSVQDQKGKGNVASN